MTRILRFALIVSIAIAARQMVAAPQSPAPVEYYRLVPGFLPETFNDTGMATGTGFATPNPWGAYTAYLLQTNAKGQRTWRIEHYLPNAAAGTAQGSSMYLFEGATLALLVDTAQNTPDTPGQNDLKTVVRHLLGHNNDGAVRPSPVDFVVSNTHSHGDHTGKNATMSDRTVYYPDLDWPRANAPAYYRPIREGGGPTANGPTGQAVSQVDLGGRLIEAVAIYAHTPGSTGYLDRENKMIATGDAIGSAYVWAHFASIRQYSTAVHHLQDVLRPFDRIDVLPAHFYQVKQGRRGGPPLSGRPLDKTYVDHQVRVADGIINGSIVGEPYRSVGRQAAIATFDSAQTVYTLSHLYPGAADAPADERARYRAIAIPGPSVPPTATGRFAAVDAIKSSIHLIRAYPNESLYLVTGSTRALLIGTGSGAPGLSALVSRLAGALPVDVVVTGDDQGQVGGLNQFAQARIFAPEAVALPAALRSVTRVKAGDRIELGVDRAGRPLVLEVHPLAGHSPVGLTLLDPTNRVLFGGDALGTQGTDAGLILTTALADFGKAFAASRTRTDGRYDVVYTAHNGEWFTGSAYVTELQATVDRGLKEGAAALIDSARLPGRKLIRSAGAADVVASIVVP
jgi:hydroxyacylglutathione hydrolase